MALIGARGELRVRVYEVMARAVEEGVACGVRRAHKHTEHPSEEALRDSIERAVMESICEVFSFEPGENI